MSVPESTLRMIQPFEIVSLNSKIKKERTTVTTVSSDTDQYSVVCKLNEMLRCKKKAVSSASFHF